MRRRPTRLLGLDETLEAVVCVGALVLWIRMVRQVTAVQESWLDERDRYVAVASA